MITSYDGKNEILNLFLKEFKEKDKLIVDYRHRPLSSWQNAGATIRPSSPKCF